jgi:glycosyltransferase involved in cell wall biosynthesis
MTTRNLLLLTYHFPPSAASGTFRMLGFARHLPAHGWNVAVIAPPEMPWDPVDPRLLEQLPAETAYHPVPYPKELPKALRWVAPYSVWLPRAWLACRRLLARHRPDAVLTSGPPHVIHLLGLALKRFHRLPWVADFRDPWVSQGKARRLSLNERWLLHWERRVMRRADRILANAPNACALLQRLYPQQAAKIVSLTNGFDPAASEVLSPGSHGGTIRMLHAGEVYAGRDPRPLLDALAELKKDSPRADLAFRLEILGKVHLRGVDLDDEIRRRDLSESVTVRAHLPYQEALDEMRRASVLVLFDSPGRTIGVPAKLYEYFGAGRPILALAERDGDTANILRESGLLHRVAPPGDAAQIRLALAELAGNMASGEAPVPDAQRLERFTRLHLAGQLAGILDRAAGKPGSHARLQACMA